MFREMAFAAQEISISENMRGTMVISHRKSGYTIAEETTGEKLTLCACAASLFEAGLSSDALQTGRLSHTYSWSV